MSTLMQANRQWSSRPNDERFTSLIEMDSHFRAQRAISKAAVVSTRAIELVPDPDNKGLAVVGSAGVPYAPTHQAFGQLATLAGAPAGYLRTLPSPLAADAMNYGLRFNRQSEEVGVLLTKNGTGQLRAATGPNYGRIWNQEITTALVNAFGDGVSGDGFRVPGEFGKAVEVTKANTTLFAGDRDMFVFLADEKNRIEVPNRRDGQAGSMARGFFVWNSEVGSTTFGIASFLFDYVCCNRIVWGAQEFKQVTIRHTKSAPDKWIEEMRPAIESYTNSSTVSVVRAIEDARSKRVDQLDDFLANRYSAKMATAIKAAHMEDEGRPIETVWDVVTGVTAYARSIPNQDARVALERDAGKLMA
jgi:hypothetical protein